MLKRKALISGMMGSTFSLAGYALIGSTERFMFGSTELESARTGRQKRSPRTAKEMGK